MLRFSSLSSSTSTIPPRILRQSSLALARTLIPIDPSLLFKTRPVEPAIRALASLLIQPPEADPGITDEEIHGPNQTSPSQTRPAF